MGAGLGELSAHREFFRVCDAVDPERSRPDQSARQDTEEAGRRPCRNYHVGPETKDKGQCGKCAPQRAQLRVLIAVGQEDGVLDALLPRKSRVCSGEPDVVALKRRPQQHQLFPVTASGGHGQYAFTRIVHGTYPGMVN